MISQHVLRFQGTRIRGRTVSLFLDGGKGCLPHGDLLPHNILAKSSKFSGFLDWGRPLDTILSFGVIAGCVTPAWSYVLGRIFSGPRREKKIEAARSDDS